eukprot:CAMPEP_0169427754 /NCGR_PEP_ID=MMETSP1042-20121227/953_1 /TAXON_ID=464988 /ORGANISM="Hemiselmis andersenii, Strain CCMP1180" /LENGTH=479 /DNA_ID=CAMNT_0009537861 /DNA_START=283 /DNA_END=1722 /DNA_ORIENTATION=-
MSNAQGSGAKMRVFQRFCSTFLLVLTVLTVCPSWANRGLENAKVINGHRRGEAPLTLQELLKGSHGQGSESKGSCGRADIDGDSRGCKVGEAPGGRTEPVGGQDGLLGHGDGHGWDCMEKTVGEHVWIEREDRFDGLMKAQGSDEQFEGEEAGERNCENSSGDDEECEDSDERVALLCHKGQMHLREGKDEEALKVYERVLRLKPDHSQAMMMSAPLVDRVRNNSTLADNLLLQAFLSRPDSASALSNYAYWLDTRYRDVIASERLYRMALKADPTSVATLNNLASLVEKREAEEDYSLDEAEALYKRRALEFEPQSVITLSNYAGMLHERKYDGERAVSLFAKALAIEPSNVDVLVNAAGVLEGDDEKGPRVARDMYLQALKMQPGHPEALMRMGRMHRVRGEWKEASDTLSKARGLHPDDEGVQLECWRLKESLRMMKEEADAQVQNFGGRLHPKIVHDPGYEEVEEMEGSSIDSME